ncbi:MAG: RidA family protein [Terriglobales bacterium]
MTVRGRMQEIGIKPAEIAPTFEFVAVNVVHDLAYVSGHAPFGDGAFQWRGKVGREFDISAGCRAAEAALLGALASLEHALGSLDRVRRIVKLNGYVNCDPGFQDLPTITDAASKLLIRLFGENGRHARTTVGVASLPFGVAVELELIVQVMSKVHGLPALRIDWIL